mmetsp:Transcript_104839/g.180786  ORF Transcript_104839/g.180786 Transcript_104839/m.180786 type:complete len:154 (-) Transcript_104839:485-946(-)
MERVNSFDSGTCRTATELEWIAECGDSPSSNMETCSRSHALMRVCTHAATAVLRALLTCWSQVRGQTRSVPPDQPSQLFSTTDGLEVEIGAHGSSIPSSTPGSHATTAQIYWSKHRALWLTFWWWRGAQACHFCGKGRAGPGSWHLLRLGVPQ